MIANLFSSFDPASLITLPLNWMRALLILIIITPTFWSVPSKKFIFFFNILSTLHKEFKTLLGGGVTLGATLLFTTLFFFILTNNFIGLFPYIFTSSRHLTLTLGLALPLWLAFIVYGWVNNTTHIFAHIVPNGTPAGLIPFMVLIESIRNLIRPITLSVRLIANMVAGHLLITLLGNQTSMASGIILTGLIMTQIMLLTLETAVAMIQSYVFAVLSTLYSSEVVAH